MRQINTGGLHLLEEFEGLSLTPYLCQAGVPTIGFGTTIYPSGNKVSLKDPKITIENAVDYLNHDLKPLCTTLENFCKLKSLYLGDNKFSALLCLAYNTGIGAIIVPEKLMYVGLIDYNPAKIKKAFLAYNKYTKIINGTPTKLVSKGLTRRREAEIKLFFSE